MEPDDADDQAELEEGWERAGRELNKRIEELGGKNAAIARKAGVDTSSLWKVRGGKWSGVSAELRAKIDKAVHWTEGTLDRIAEDPEFSPPSAVLSDPERVDLLEREVREIREEYGKLREDVERMTRAVEQLADRLQAPG